eukprot:3868-Heterococcus_DN1.PRE.9
MGQTRVSSYYKWLPIPERVALEAEVVRRCFSRSELQCSFFEFRGYKIIYRRYASLFFIVGVDSSDAENELGILEFIHCLVETLLVGTQRSTFAALNTLPVSMWQAYQQAVQCCGARVKLQHLVQLISILVCAVQAACCQCDACTASRQFSTAIAASIKAAHLIYKLPLSRR